MDVFFSQDPWRLLQPLTLALKAIDIQNVAAEIRIGQAAFLCGGIRQQNLRNRAGWNRALPLPMYSPANRSRQPSGIVLAGTPDRYLSYHFCGVHEAEVYTCLDRDR